MKHLRISGYLLLLGFTFLAGCTTVYTMGGREFPTKEEALEYQKSIAREQLEKVPRVRRFEGSLMISLPPDERIASSEFVRGAPGMTREQLDFFVQYYKNDADALKMAVLKSGMFESVAMVQGTDQLQLASDLGYKYVFRTEDKPDVSLTDVASGRKLKFSISTGLQDAIPAMVTILRKLDAEGDLAGLPSGKTQVSARPVEEMEYSQSTKRGWVSIKAQGLGARRELLRRIAEICATKNKMLVSDDSQITGTFKVLDEELKDGVLKIYFESMY